MPSIKLFSVKAIVKGKVAILDLTTKIPLEDTESLMSETFDEKEIAKKAQEVSTFNNQEKTMVESIGDGEYTIDLKVIV